MDTLRDDDLPCPFPPEVRAKGEAILAKGELHLRERPGNQGPFEARVPFFRRFHEVWLEVDEAGGVGVDCSCPHLVNTGEGCEHVWALVLAARKELGGAAGEEEDEEAPIPVHYQIEGGCGPLRIFLTRAPTEDDEASLEALVVDGETLARLGSEEEDRPILATLARAAGGRLSLLDGGGFKQPKGPWAIPADAISQLLVRLTATERAFAPGRRGQRRPLRLDEDPTAWELLLRLEPGDAGKARLRGWLERDGKRIRLDEMEVLVDQGDALGIRGGRVQGIRTHGANEWLAILARKKAMEVPAKDAASFLGRLARSGPLPRLWLGDSADPLPVAAGGPQGRFSVAAEDGEMRGTLAFLYAGIEVGEGGADRLLFDPEGPRQLARDAEAEAALAARLEEGGALRDPERWGCFQVDVVGIETFLGELLEEGWVVDLDGAALRAPARRVTRRVDRAGGFTLGGGLDFGVEEVPWDRVLSAFRAGKSFITLRDGSTGSIPPAWVRNLERIARLGNPDDEGIAFERGQELLVTAALDDGLDAEGRDALGRTLRRLGKPRPCPAPQGLRATLRHYQEDGLAWLNEVATAEIGACLADDMGLGKTLQVLALLEKLRSERKKGFPRTSLVVLPRSLIWNWEAEAERFTPELKLARYLDSGRDKLLPNLGEHDLVLTTYGVVRRDIELLENIPFAAVVLDEAQAIKNPGAQATQAVGRLDARVRLAITGTPVENRLRDFWSISHFLNPGLFGSERRFGDAFAGEGRELLHRLVQPLLKRRTKEEVAPELPPRIEQRLVCPLSPTQERIYGEIRGRLAASLDEGQQRPLHVLEGLLRLRQAACHPRLLEDESPGRSGKLDVLLEHLEEIVEAGHQAAVFSQFTSFLDLVGEALEERKIDSVRLDGSTRDRETPVKSFQEGDAPVILLSLKVGGVGLNLTAADYVFLLDPWWNPAAEAQAVDRAHRIGRERPVVAYRMVAEGTVEERILALQDRKKDLARMLLEPSEGGLSALDADDLLFLVG